MWIHSLCVSTTCVYYGNVFMTGRLEYARKCEKGKSRVEDIKQGTGNVEMEMVCVKG